MNELKDLLESENLQSLDAGSVEPLACSPAPAGERRVSLRPPNAEDGSKVHDLVGQCPPLDTNSLYANVLQCTHFGDTCATAWRGGELIGWLSGHLIPGRPDTFFLWQVAVAPQARGLQLSRQLIDSILRRPYCRQVTALQASVTDDNLPSLAFFKSFARSRNAPMHVADWFDRDRHFAGKHDSEKLIRIGPLSRLAGRAADRMA